MDRKTEISDHFIHVGGGTSMALAWLGLIPGVLPFLALTVLVGAVLVLPLAVLGLVAGIVAAPPYAAWRFIGWGRRRRMNARDRSARPDDPAPEPVAMPAPAREPVAMPAPYSGMC